ncbi:hypothetical protein BBO99_00004102 [Phytophthora kernoviae]|uniref:PDZ domain-containing protein n=1 Tax=Phytophthora kernoviae TaxID=325452 RepID=A0A3R7GZP7_9STRA|nr:hypothetical protein JM16_003850 [Phytophthora kernoviae]RLM96904.1 hypothetical protein BBI17_004270 [Phytophthora kernoviae]RLN80992.1 hypothetical protein BBO99_00004102 [Phytophthora kernoviae]
MALRSWSWTRIDGRNVLAVPTQTEIRLYDSDDFILLTRLSPSGHQTPVIFVRWSAFHGKLASLSSSQILVHAPQRDQDERSSVHFAVICSFRLDEAHTSIRGLAFSRNANELLFSGRNVGVGKLDVRSIGSNEYSEEQSNILWETSKGACDMAKFSPSAFVFATLTLEEPRVQVWRMARRLGDADQNQQLAHVETLEHPDPVVYFSWKPSTTQWHSVLETDGTRKAQWFEPARILLTCSVTRTVRIWTESIEVNETGTSGQPRFVSVLVFEPPHPVDNFRWVMSKNRNISDENFQVVNDVHDTHAEWISGVDQQGILRLWRVVGLMSSAPTVEETSLQIKVNGESDQEHSNGPVSPSVRLGEACVMAYFSQNYFGMPSKLFCRGSCVFPQRESGLEYEVACEKPAGSELGIQLAGREGKLLVSRNSSSNKFVSQVTEGDELVGINNKSVVGKDPSEGSFVRGKVFVSAHLMHLISFRSTFWTQ